MMLLGSLAFLSHLQMRGTWALVSLSFALANFIVLGVALYPRKMIIDGQNARSDGRLLWELFSISDEEIGSWVFGRYYHEAVACRKRGDCAGAERWLTKALQERPEDVACLWGLALLQFDIAQFAAARLSFIHCLEQTPANSEFRPYLLDWIACTDLRIAGRAELLEADRFSSEAVEAMPWISEFKQTRRCVLFALKKQDKGQSILR